MGVETVVAFFVFAGTVAVNAAISFGVSYVATKLFMEEPEQQQFESGVKLNKRGATNPIPILYGRRTVGGSIVFMDVNGSDNKNLHMVVALAEGEVHSINDVFLNDIVHNDSEWGGTVTAYKDKIGADNQTAHSALVSEFSEWTNDHRLRGVANVYLKIRFDQEVWSGVPDITADVKGLKVYDPRDGSTAWSDNPALCLRDYLINSRYGRGIPSSMIDDDSFEAAANYCEEIVTFKNADGTNFQEKRFTCNGVLSPDESAIDNVKKLLSSCRGTLVFSSGKYKLVLDKPETAIAFNFNDDNICGNLSLGLGDKTNIFNKMRVNYFDKDLNFEQSYLLYDNSTLRSTQDNGLDLIGDLKLPMTNTRQRVYNIAQQEVKKSRQSIVVSFKSTLEALKCDVGDLVTITDERIGFSLKKFRIVRLTMNADDTIQVAVKEYDGSVYTDDEYVPPAEPDQLLPSDYIRNPVANLNATSSDIFIQGDGSIVSRLRLAWDAPDNGYAVGYEIGYKKSTESNYTQVVISNEESQYVLTGVQDGVVYNTRVRVIYFDNTKSAYVTLNHTVQGKLTAPSAPSDLQVSNELGNVLRLQWTGVNDSDLLGYRIRYHAENAPVITNPVVSGITNPTAANGTYEPDTVQGFVQGRQVFKKTGNYQSVSGVYRLKFFPNQRGQGSLLNDVWKIVWSSNSDPDTYTVIAIRSGLSGSLLLPPKDGWQLDGVPDLISLSGLIGEFSDANGDYEKSDTDILGKSRWILDDDYEVKWDGSRWTLTEFTSSLVIALNENSEIVSGVPNQYGWTLGEPFVKNIPDDLVVSGTGIFAAIAGTFSLSTQLENGKRKWEHDTRDNAKIYWNSTSDRWELFDSDVPDFLSPLFAFNTIDTNVPTLTGWESFSFNYPTSGEPSITHDEEIYVPEGSLSLFYTDASDAVGEASTDELIAYSGGEKTTPFFNDMSPLFLGNVGMSPYETISFRERGFFTFAIVAVDTTGNISTPAYASVNIVENGTVVDSVAPDIPSGITATSLFEGILLEWVNPVDSNFHEAEIWASETNSRTTASKILTSGGTIAHIDRTVTTTLYFWIRGVNITGTASDFSEGATSTVSASARLELVEEDIEDGAITDAKIGTVSAGKLTAGTIQSADITLQSSSGIIKSSTYDGAGNGWKISGDGTADFSDMIVRGNSEVSSAAGNYIQSSGFVSGTSGWRINGDGSAEFNTINIYGTVAIPRLFNGFDEISSGGIYNLIAPTTFTASTQANTVIRFTTDGTIPTVSSAVFPATGFSPTDRDVLLRMIAFENVSGRSSATFTAQLRYSVPVVCDAGVTNSGGVNRMSIRFFSKVADYILVRTNFNQQQSGWGSRAISQYLDAEGNDAGFKTEAFTRQISSADVASILYTFSTSSSINDRVGRVYLIHCGLGGNDGVDSLLWKSGNSSQTAYVYAFENIVTFNDPDDIGSDYAERYQLKTSFVSTNTTNRPAAFITDYPDVFQ